MPRHLFSHHFQIVMSYPILRGFRQSRQNRTAGEICPQPDKSGNGARARTEYSNKNSKRVINTWHIDPGMFSDADFLGVSKHHCLFTPHAIDPLALRMYSFDLENYNLRNPKSRYKNGSAHIRPMSNDFDTLMPSDEVNCYIRSKAA